MRAEEVRVAEQRFQYTPILEHAIEVQRGMTLQHCIMTLHQRFPTGGEAVAPGQMQPYALVFGPSPPLPWTIDYVRQHLDAQLPRLHVIEKLLSTVPPPVPGLSPVELSLALNRIQILDWYQGVTNGAAAGRGGDNRAERLEASSKCDRLIDILLQPCFALSYLSCYYPRWYKDDQCFLKDWSDIRTQFGPGNDSNLSTSNNRYLRVQIHGTNSNKRRDSFAAIEKIFLKRLALSALLLRPPGGGCTKLMDSPSGLGASFADVKLMVQYHTHSSDPTIKKVETASAADPDHDGVTPTFFAELAQAFIERERMWLPCCLTSSLQENSQFFSPGSPLPTDSPVKSSAAGGGVAPENPPGRRTRAIKSVRECGLFPRPLMRGYGPDMKPDDVLNDFRLFGFCLGIALRDGRLFPMCMSVAFADALCGKRISLWDVMIGQFKQHSNRYLDLGPEIMEYLDSGLFFGFDMDDESSVEGGQLHDIPNLSLLAPEVDPALPPVPLHALCPSSIVFEATGVSKTTAGCLLLLSQHDLARFPHDVKKGFTQVAISGAILPEGW
jgi:hypothetical protein